MDDNTRNQDAELENLLNKYSDEVNKLSQSENPQTPPQELGSNFESPEPEPQPPVSNNQEMPQTPEIKPEPSLDSGFDYQIPPQNESFASQSSDSGRVDTESVLPPIGGIPVSGFQNKINFFKILFFISFLIFFGVLVAIFFTINNQREVPVSAPLPTPTLEPIVIPTATPIPTVEIIPTISLIPTIEVIAPTASPTATQIPTVTPLPTKKVSASGLETYTNQELGFQLKYPSTWTVNKFENVPGKVNFNDGEEGMWLFVVEVKDTDQDLVTNTQSIIRDFSGYFVNTVSDTTIGGTKAKKIETVAEGGGNVQFVMIKDNKVYHITVRSVDKTITNILKTFLFI